MMRRSVVSVVFSIGFVLSVGSAFTPPRASAQTLLPINIGYQATADWLLFTARDLQLFEKAGLAPTYVKFVAGAPMIAAAQSQTIDVAAVGSVPFLIGLSQGVDWVIIGIHSEGAYAEGFVVRKDSGIDTPADLKGKRIGYFRGSTTHYGVMMVLRQVGIRPDQVTLLHLSPAEQLAAMAAKEIDAAMAWEPWMQRMVHEANARIIATEGDIGIYTNVATYSARRDWLRGHRETAVRFLRALLMAYDILQKDPTVGVRALTEEMGIKKAWTETIYRDAPPPRIYEWANPRYDYALVKGSAFVRRLGDLAAFLLAEKVIPTSIDVSDTTDASVITEALAARKGGRYDTTPTSR
jgi:aliphatic sulfonates family ABC transporter substrate-binding protein